MLPAIKVRRPLAQYPVLCSPRKVSRTILASILNGVFILRGDNWARWLPFSWMALHVVISFVDSLQKVATHALFFVVIGYLLFRPEARAYFQPQKRERNAPA